MKYLKTDLYLYIFYRFNQFSFSCLTDDSRAEASFSYVVENISKLKETQLSAPIMVRNLPWKIMAMPRYSQQNDRHGQQKSLGFFLQCNADAESS